ncbi:hypothetical protein GCM10010341_08910 [Streptomyces noursei]|nr:hypothetical protein GCM10010341_08910 [Streptomyces noursei]
MNRSIRTIVGRYAPRAQCRSHLGLPPPPSRDRPARRLPAAARYDRAPASAPTAPPVSNSRASRAPVSPSGAGV